MAEEPLTAIVLAGSRAPNDPVAQSQNKELKAFVHIHGKAMIDYLLEALVESKRVEKILIIMPHNKAFNTEAPFMNALIQSGQAALVTPDASPARSVLKAFKVLNTWDEVLLTTADHPLLSPEMIAEFLDARQSAVSIAMAKLETVTSAYPQTKRTRLRFSDGGYSGCNLFAFDVEAGRKIVSFWTRLEAYRKNPLRMAREIGTLTLFRYVLKMLSLRDALSAIGRKAGVEISPVILDIPEAAIDVDKLDDLVLVSGILEGQH